MLEKNAKNLESQICIWPSVNFGMYPQDKIVCEKLKDSKEKEQLALTRDSYYWKIAKKSYRNYKRSW